MVSVNIKVIIKYTMNVMNNNGNLNVMRTKNKDMSALDEIKLDLTNTCAYGFEHRQKYMPCLTKVRLFCDEIKKDRKRHIGGKCLELKVLTMSHQCLEDLMKNSQLIQRIVNKEFLMYDNRLTNIEPVRNILLTKSLINEQNPSKEDTCARVVKELVKLASDDPCKDPALIIKKYDIDEETCSYSIINCDGIFHGEL